MPATLFGAGPTRLEDLPDINDVKVFSEILCALGARVDRQEDGSVIIDPTGLSRWDAPYELVKRLRASYYLLGVLLGRFGKAEVALPGGCDIGLRPIDQHLKGFRALGAQVSMEHGTVKLKAKELRGAEIYLDVVSVGATINIMLAATMAKGTTVIENAAKEPHIVDLANLLNAMGARVQGAGTDVVKIRGTDQLNGCTHAVIPDDIEAGTYVMMAAATHGDVRVENIIPQHLDSVLAKLREAGVIVEENGDWVRVAAPGRLKAVSVKTLPYPGFPTDLQQPFVAMMTMAEGVSIVHETIWDNRFGYANELIRMGARIKIDGRTAFIEGVPKLFGIPVCSKNDLRAGAALIIAALSADGESEVDGMEYVDRGYERIDEKMRSLGAIVRRVV
jgi:UDP-N-acetylglucosamine 1-carboxyvinyltransferase